MKRALACLSIMAVIVLPGHAQWEDDWDVWQTETDAGLTAAWMPDADEAFLVQAWAGISRNRVLENGLEIGAEGRLEIQKDHPARAGFSGVPAGFEGNGGAPQGAFTGIAVGAPAEDDSVRLQLERAFLYADGGYGEVRAGRDDGVAARFQEGAPSIFDTLAVGRQRLDPAGMDIVTTRHDLTGPSAKLSYTTPRLLGLRAGVSYTPEAGARGLDRDPNRNLPGAAPITLRHAMEGALNVSRRLSGSGIRLRGALAASTAEVDAPAYAAPLYDRVTTWSAGASAEFETVTLGVSWLESDNGLATGGTYQAWTAGFTKTLGKYVIGADYGGAEDDLTGLEAETWTIGVSRTFTKNAKISLGYRENSLESVTSLPNFAASRPLSPDGIVMEITLSK